MIEKTLQEFTEVMDGLYYEGFTEQFAREYPKEFLDELNQFLDSITWKPSKAESR
jgi:hypothetical protein